jgi:hypothetical protein
VQHSMLIKHHLRNIRNLVSMKNIESIRKCLKDSRQEALSLMSSIRNRRGNLRNKNLRTKNVVISVVSQVTLQRIAKLRKPLSN